MFEALTQFLPRLQAADFSGGGGSPVAGELRQAIGFFVGRHWELGLSDAIGILRRAGLWNAPSPLDARLDALDGRTVAALVAYAERKDRLCEGSFLDCLASGQMAQWLARLRAIDEAGEDAVARRRTRRRPGWKPWLRPFCSALPAATPWAFRSSSCSGGASRLTTCRAGARTASRQAPGPTTPRLPWPSP